MKKKIGKPCVSLLWNYQNETEAAKKLNLSPRTLKSWRSKKYGLSYIRLSAKLIRYCPMHVEGNRIDEVVPFWNIEKIKDGYLDEQQVSELLDVSIRTLQDWRVDKIGPPTKSMKKQHRTIVRYPINLLMDFIESKTIFPESESTDWLKYTKTWKAKAKQKALSKSLSGLIRKIKKQHSQK